MANSIDYTYKKNYHYLLLLLLILTIAFWAISFHIFSLKNDALNYFLPVRHLVSESWFNNLLPAWTPYLNLGYPLHGDMQSGVWNPIVQAFSLFGPYTLYTLQLETLLYIYLSGVGLFFLLKYFNLHPYANITASVAFMLCGFNLDSCQFLNWIAGTAFLPFIILFYYRCLVERSYVQSIYTGTGLFFLFTCAYPADFIITSYLLFFFLVSFLYQNFRKKEKINIKTILISHVIIVVTFLLLSAPAILSYIQSLPLQERGKGAAYELAMSNPLHPYLLSTFTTPLSGWKMPGTGITDPLERNSYIGLAAFTFFLIGFFNQQKNWLLRFSKWAVLILLLFSFGESGLIRVIAYYTLPLMDSFRHPANAKMFTLFFACLLSGFTFNAIIKKEIASLKIKKGFWITGSILLTVFVISLFTPIHIFRLSTFQQLFTRGKEVTFFDHLKNTFSTISFADLVILSTIIQIPFFGLLYKYLVKKDAWKKSMYVAIANCMLFAMLLQPFTVVKKQRASAAQHRINIHTVKKYPLPDLTSSLKNNSTDNEKYMAEMGCLALYNKKIGRSAYRISPSNLLLQNEFWFYEDLRNKVMEYPVLYKADTVISLKGRENSSTDTIKKSAYVEEVKNYRQFIHSGYSLIELTKFDPGHFEGTITSDTNSLFVLQQNRFPRWKLYIDGKEETIEKVNVAFMGFFVKKGKHHFLFTYETTDLKLAFVISLLTLALVFCIFILPYLKKKRKTRND